MKSEFEFLADIRRKYNLTRIGDDCAVLPKDAKTDLVITTDLLVEDIDFRLDWTRPEFLGHKALAVSLSDVAAMGAKPVWAMLSIGVPEKIWKTDFIDKFYEGWFALADKFGVELIGGDVSKTPDKIVIDSIAAGEVRKGKAVLRSGAKAGDLILATGFLGDAAAALRLLEKGERYGQSDYNDLLLKQLRPNPQTEIGQFIGENNLATAMIDLSDGLAADLFHICRESNVGATLFEDKIPFQNPFYKFYPIFNLADSEENIYFSGEDFELLFTVSGDLYSEIEYILRNYQVIQMGRVTDKIEIINLRSRILKPRGFTHF